MKDSRAGLFEFNQGPGFESNLGHATVLKLSAIHLGATMLERLISAVNYYTMRNTIIMLERLISAYLEKIHYFGNKLKSMSLPFG